MMIIRQATNADLPRLLELLQQLCAVETDFDFHPIRATQALEALLHGPDSDVLVAERDEQVVAMASLQRLVSTAMGGGVGLVEDLVVDRDHRGIGIGRQLLSALEELAVARGWLRLQLLADADNQPALAFYRQNGWSPTRLIALRKILDDSKEFPADSGK
jgi:GNAT superfamily N-acetyltransferase